MSSLPTGSGATEVCHIISGSGTVVGEDRTRADIGPGTLLVLPRGWRGTWFVKEAIRKTYVMVWRLTGAALARPKLGP